MITAKLLIENGFEKGTINGRTFFCKGDIVLFYNVLNWHIGHILNGDIYAIPNVNGFTYFSELRQILAEVGKSI